MCIATNMKNTNEDKQSNGRKWNNRIMRLKISSFLFIFLSKIVLVCVCEHYFLCLRYCSSRRQPIWSFCNFVIIFRLGLNVIRIYFDAKKKMLHEWVDAIASDFDLNKKQNSSNSCFDNYEIQFWPVIKVNRR